MEVSNFINNNHPFLEKSLRYLINYILLIDEYWMILYREYPPKYIQIFKLIRKEWEIDNINISDVKIILQDIFQDDYLYIQKVNINDIHKSNTTKNKNKIKINKILCLLELFTIVNPHGDIENDEHINKCINTLKTFPMNDTSSYEQQKHRINSQKKKIINLSKEINNKTKQISSQNIKIDTSTEGNLNSNENEDEDEDEEMEDEDEEMEDEDEDTISRLNRYNSKSLIKIIEERESYGQPKFLTFIKSLIFNIKNFNSNESKIYFKNWTFDSFIPKNGNIFNALYCYNVKMNDFIHIKSLIKYKQIDKISTNMFKFESAKVEQPSYKLNCEFWDDGNKISGDWIDAFFELCFTSYGRTTFERILPLKLNIKKFGFQLKESLEEEWENINMECKSLMKNRYPTGSRFLKNTKPKNSIYSMKQPSSYSKFFYSTRDKNNTSVVNNRLQSLFKY